LKAVIFDMDGLLIDSEPLWEQANLEVFDEIGIRYDDAYFLETMGMRVDQIIADWHAREPWNGPSPAEVTERMAARVVTLIAERGEPMPGALETVAFFNERAIPVAVASSSPYPVIAANIAVLGIGDKLAAVSSAVDEAHGKPHPAVYLKTAEKLGLPARSCLVFEDAVMGVVAAKAAQMTCICVPHAVTGADKRLGIADYVLPSLHDFDETLWQSLNGRQP
jgi:mannitol-1-/sugar-/sorbitol-6-/2-deoxyglucose-6-phosphatase